MVYKFYPCIIMVSFLVIFLLLSNPKDLKCSKKEGTSGSSKKVSSKKEEEQVILLTKNCNENESSVNHLNQQKHNCAKQCEEHNLPQESSNILFAISLIDIFVGQILIVYLQNVDSVKFQRTGFMLFVLSLIMFGTIYLFSAWKTIFFKLFGVHWIE